MTWKNTLFTAQKGQGLPLVTENKRKSFKCTRHQLLFWSVLLLMPSVLELALFPVILVESSVINSLFPKRRMSFWHTHRQRQADNLPFQTRKSWLVAFAYRVSPILPPWLTSYYQNGTPKCGTRERSMELTLLSWYKFTSSSHCQRPILIPSVPLDTDWSRIKFVNPNADKHQCRELVQMP